MNLSIPSKEIGLGYFQETHPTGLFKECSHYVELVSSAAQFPRVLARAMRTAIEERGVAVIALPGDVALSDAPTEKPGWSATGSSAILPSDIDIDRLAAMLNESEAVTLMCGSGTAGTQSGCARGHAGRTGRPRDARQTVH